MHRARATEVALREQLARHEAEASLTERHGSVSELLVPIRETLSRYDAALGELGRAQARVAGQITERLDAVTLAGETLRHETQQLSQALRAPVCVGNGANCSCGGCVNWPACWPTVTSNHR